jgi:phospholipid/cholesterol/gamma-HCH transport system substrate-binding protein
MNPYKYPLVGAVLLIAAFLFIGGGLWLRGKSFGGPDLFVVYADIGTLKDASTVRISGAAVGRVDGISYVAPGRVVVGLALDKKVQVTSTAAAVVTPVGVLGDEMVVLDPGKGTLLAKGDTIRGTVAVGMFDKAAVIADKAAETMTKLDAMLDTNLVIELRHTLQSTQKLMARLADEKTGPTAQINPTMVSLQKTSARLDSTLSQIDPKKLQARVDSTMKSAGGAADRLAAMSAHADSLILRIQGSNGTIGKFLNDSSFYNDLRKTMQSMNALLEEIKKNPGKIGVTVKVF